VPYGLMTETFQSAEIGLFVQNLKKSLTITASFITKLLMDINTEHIYLMSV